MDVLAANGRAPTDSRQRRLRHTTEPTTTLEPSSRRADTCDLLALYLLEIGTIPLLSRSDEQRLGQAIQEGRDAAARLASPIGRSEVDDEGLEATVQRARDATRELVCGNLPLVVFVAKAYQRSGMPLLDLIQEGNVGLIRAAEKFDVRRGVRFSTHATWWIRQSIQVAVARDARTIHLPQRLSQDLARLYGTESRLQVELGRRPTPDELGRELGIGAAEVRKLTTLPGRPRSLDESVGPSGDTQLGDLIADSTPSPEALAAVAADVARLLSVLDEREKQVLTLRFGLGGERPLTFREVGRIVGLSAQRVRQIHVRAVAKLTEAAGE